MSEEPAVAKDISWDFPIKPVVPETTNGAPSPAYFPAAVPMPESKGTTYSYCIPPAPLGPDGKPVKRERIGYNIQSALCDVIDKKKMTDRPDYAVIAKRHGTTAENLRRVYSRWRKGLIEMGPPSTEREKQIDARTQLEQTIALSRRYKAVLLQSMERLLTRAESKLLIGQNIRWKSNEIPFVVRELRGIDSLQVSSEKGYSTLLDDEAGRRQREEKFMGNLPNSAPKLAERLNAVNDEELAMKLLAVAPPEETPDAV